MIISKTWSGASLEGYWDFTIKIDGVRGLYRDGWYSRSGNPLYNVPEPPEGVFDAEIYCGSFKQTMELVKSQQPNKVIAPEHIYSLDPLDQRLIYGSIIQIL